MYGIASLLNGRTLCGRYRVEAVVGRGGMGAVYRARDERLGRPVAVKVIGIVAADPEEHGRLRARFLREARAAAGLHHPNVVAVHDFGSDDELGLDFLVMELLHGEDLASRLGRAGPPPLGESLAILRQAARGVAAGHRAGLVHRDVKPANLFLEAGDGQDEPHVRVLDFGIAQLCVEEGSTMTRLTEYGRTPFSPAYASPEQLRGDERITAASDVFSLAAVGYHLLTGARPFTSTDPARMSLETAAAVTALDDLAHAAPLAVRDALARALSPEPGERFADAAELALALGAVGTPGATTERPRAPLGAVSVHPGDVGTRLATSPPGPGRAPAPSLARPAPAAPLAHAGDHPAAREPGPVARGLLAVWDFIVSLLVMALFVGAWGVAVQGVMDSEPLLVWGGIAAAALATPAAIHRLTGRGGRYGAGVVACVLATGGVLYAMGPDEDPAFVLAAAFGVQVVAALLAAAVTRRAPPVAAAGASPDMP
jgi:eukaryotic-like serine/threonine-protein kinase